MNDLLNVSHDTAIKITYGAMFSVIGVLIGFSVWMTSMELHAQEQSDRVERLEKLTSKYEEYLISIDKRLYRIEILLEKQFKK